MAALELGREDEALREAMAGEAGAAADDFAPRAVAKIVRARVLARRGDFTAARVRLEAAATLIDPTDYAQLHFDLAMARAEVARLEGRPDEERDALRVALDAAEAKGNVLAAGRARDRLEEL